jgi:hypothetical protein
MAKRGRVSIDELMVTDCGLAASLPRPDAPYDVTDEEVEVWRTVNSMPADHLFRQIITYSLSFAGTLWKLAGLR